MNLEWAISTYADDLQEYIKHEKLPAEWFGRPDHIAVKAASAAHFDVLLQQIKKGPPPAEQVVTDELDGRRISTAILAGALAVGEQWQVSLVEVMEPRPEKQGKDKVGLDHMEFVNPEFDEIARQLNIRGILFEPQKKLGHATLSITFNLRHELKFTDRPLAEVINKEQANAQENL